MKKIFWMFFLIAIKTPAVFAATQDDINTGTGTKVFKFPNPIDSKNFTQLANKLVDFLLVLAVPISIIMVIWAGLLFMTAGGNPDRVEQGRNTILWTAIGIGVLMISKSITYLLQNILGA